MNNSKILSMALLCTCLLSITNGFAASGPAWAGTGTLRSRGARQLEKTQQERDEARRVGADLRVQRDAALENLGALQSSLGSTIQELREASERCEQQWNERAESLEGKVAAIQTRVDAVEACVEDLTSGVTRDRVVRIEHDVRGIGRRLETLQEQQPRVQIFPDQGGYKAQDMYERALEIKDKSTKLEKAVKEIENEDCRKDCCDCFCECLVCGIKYSAPVAAGAMFAACPGVPRPLVVAVAGSAFVGAKSVERTESEEKSREEFKEKKEQSLHHLKRRINDYTGRVEKDDGKDLKKILRYYSGEETPQWYGLNLSYYYNNLKHLHYSCSSAYGHLDRPQVRDLQALIKTQQKEVQELAKYNNVPADEQEWFQ